jgi:hypothetical protein
MKRKSVYIALLPSAEAGKRGPYKKAIGGVVHARLAIRGGLAAMRDRGPIRWHGLSRCDGVRIVRRADDRVGCSIAGNLSIGQSFGRSYWHRFQPTFNSGHTW